MNIKNYLNYYRLVPLRLPFHERSCNKIQSQNRPRQHKSVGVCNVGGE